MNTTLTVLAQVHVKTFYRENASFFLVVIGIGGGFMSSVEHKALAEFFISSPITTLIPVFIWVLYALKVTRYNSATTRRKENEFMLNHSLFPAGQQRLNVLFVLFNQLAPAILYGGFIAITAVKYRAWPEFAIVIAGLLSILIATSLHLKSALSNPDAEIRVSMIERILNRFYTRSYPLFVIEWLARKKTFLLLSTIAFSSMFVFGVLMLYTTDTYDFRLLQMALVIIVSGNVQLIREVQLFETHHFAVVNQMPISFLKRACYLLPVFIFISFPQIALLTRYFPDNLAWITMAECIAFTLGYSFFLYGLAYVRQQTQEKFMRQAFGLALLLFVLTLFSLPVWLATVMSTLTGLLIWKSNFYRSEVMMEKPLSKTS